MLYALYPSLPILLALALVFATAVVWSTRDASRFTIAPLCVLAPVAATELMLWRRRLMPARPWVLALLVGLWAGVFAQRSAQFAHRTATPPPEYTARETVPTLDDPWGYALLTGRPAVLARPPQTPSK